MKPNINSSSEEEISFKTASSQAGTIELKPSILSQITFQPRKIDLHEGTEISIQRHDEGDKNEKTTSNLLFTCPVMSGTHAKLKFSQGKFFVFDCNSTNGTFLTRSNCEKFRLESAKSYILDTGDILQFGQSLLDPLDDSKKPCLIAEVNILENKSDTNLQGKIDTKSDVPNQEEKSPIVEKVPSVNKSPSIEKSQNVEKPGILKKFQCQDCTKSFRSKDVFDLHLIKHMDKEDKKKKEVQWSAKMKGIRKIPTSPYIKDLMNKTKALTCKKCSKMFMTIGLLNDHFQLYPDHIKLPDEKEKDNGSNKESEKTSYKCNNCEEIYSTEKDLDTHVNLNHAENEQVEDFPQNQDSPKAQCGKI